MLANASTEPRGGLLVDLGCGSRPYRDLVEKHGFRYAGADLPGNPDADLLTDDEGRVDLADGQAALVLSSQVLEHVRDPNRYLREAHRILAPTGNLILSTHGIWPYHPDPQDFWRWTARGLRETLLRAGFETDELRGILGLPAAGLQLLQDHVLRILPRPLHALTAAAAQSAIWLADARTAEMQRATDAMVFIVRARRQVTP